MDPLHLLALLFIKHFIADVAIQSHVAREDKSEYLGTGHYHYLDHALLTFAIFSVWSPWYLPILFAGADYLIHWHIDYAKCNIKRFYAIDTNSIDMYLLHILDQMIHLITYCAFVYVLI